MRATKERIMKRKTAIFLMALRDSLPILMGYGTMGFAAGVVFAACSGAERPALWSGAIAASSFSGTLQFAIGGWFKGDSSLAFVALATLAISFRYAFYGFSLIGKWRGIGLLRKAFLILGLTDENYALESSRRIPGRRDFARYCTFLTSLNLLYWTGGCTLGALVGSAFKLPDKGIDFVMAALFLTVLTDQARSLVSGARKGGEK